MVYCCFLPWIHSRFFPYNCLFLLANHPFLVCLFFHCLLAYNCHACLSLFVCLLWLLLTARYWCSPLSFAVFDLLLIAHSLFHLVRFAFCCFVSCFNTGLCLVQRSWLPVYPFLWGLVGLLKHWEGVYPTPSLCCAVHLASVSRQLKTSKTLGGYARRI